MHRRARPQGKCSDRDERLDRPAEEWNDRAVSARVLVKHKGDHSSTTQKSKHTLQSRFPRDNRYPHLRSDLVEQTGESFLFKRSCYHSEREQPCETSTPDLPIAQMRSDEYHTTSHGHRSLNVFDTLDGRLRHVSLSPSWEPQYLNRRQNHIDPSLLADVDHLVMVYFRAESDPNVLLHDSSTR